jgi:hypothetical protein
VNRAFLVPLFVYVVAKFFNSLRNFPGCWRLMLAASYFNFRRTPISCIARDPGQRLSVKIEKLRRPEFKGLSL